MRLLGVAPNPRFEADALRAPLMRAVSQHYTEIMVRRSLLLMPILSVPST